MSGLYGIGTDLQTHQNAAAAPTLAPSGSITFTGGAGLGVAGGSVTIFTITGRIAIVNFPPPFCTTSLGEAAPTATVSLGVASSTALFVAASNSVDIDQNEWWFQNDPPAGYGVDTTTKIGGLATYPGLISISEDIIITCAAQNTNSGVLEFTGLRYYPLTAGAKLTLGPNMVAI